VIGSTADTLLLLAIVRPSRSLEHQLAMADDARSSREARASSSRLPDDGRAGDGLAENEPLAGEHRAGPEAVAEIDVALADLSRAAGVGSREPRQVGLGDPADCPKPEVHDLDGPPLR
jgi:hypothetical protein